MDTITVTNFSLRNIRKKYGSAVPGRQKGKVIIMKYAIIGAGGTGGILGFYMTKAGRDVTLIARGRHLAAMQEKGLAVEKMWDGTTEIIPVKATDMEHYAEQPDVVLVCVKGYSLEDTIPFIKRVAKPSTIVIPVLNIYGVLIQHGRILRVVYGVRNMSSQKVNVKRAHSEERMDDLKNIKKDFDDSGIDGVLSENIQRDALEKFSYVSPIGAAGLYYHATAADFQREGEQREAFKTMIREIAALAEAMGVPFQRDMVEVNLNILSTLAPEATTSMQRDVMEGKDSEIDGLVYEVVRMGERYHVPVPMYAKVAEKLRRTP